MAALLVPLLLATGCATLSETPEETVARRAKERADALMAWDLDKAIEYSTPSYREVYGKGDLGSAYFGARRWTNAEVSQVACEEDRCRVKMMISYKWTRPAFENERPIIENWVLVDGQWYVTKR